MQVDTMGHIANSTLMQDELWSPDCIEKQGPLTGRSPFETGEHSRGGIGPAANEKRSCKRFRAGQLAGTAVVDGVSRQ